MSLQSQVFVYFFFFKSIQELQLAINITNWYKDGGEVFIAITLQVPYPQNVVHRVDQTCFQNFTHTQNVSPDIFKLQAQT